MPLRDHFRPPTSKVQSWETLHGGWPMVIVQQLKDQLPNGYVASLRVHHGMFAGADLPVYVLNEPSDGFSTRDDEVATPTWATPSLVVEIEVPDFDVYEVQVYDVQHERKLVAAIEIVSPRNKDRPEARNAFVGKCAALLQQGVAVSIVDIVTPRHANLYAELLEFVGQADPLLGTEPAGLYAVSCRWLLGEHRAKFEAWSHTLTLGQPLPSLPLWLTRKEGVPLDLEMTYEKTCSDFRIP